MVVELHCDGQEGQEAQVTQVSQDFEQKWGPLCRNLGVTHETVLARKVSILHAGSIWPHLTLYSHSAAPVFSLCQCVISSIVHHILCVNLCYLCSKFMCLFCVELSYFPVLLMF